VARGFVIKGTLSKDGMVAGSAKREEGLLTQILLEQPGEHRVPIRDKIRLPLL
jgi:hypothetical protein